MSPPLRIDVFNGDADGLCALQQLRLHEPVSAQLITGVKRDIRLLARIPECSGAHITVLDISLEVNREALLLLLRDNHVRYFDHHFAGALPESPQFEAHINTDPEVCTSSLVDAHLHGSARLWAIAGAFGDNQHALAQQLAASRDLNPSEVSRLQEVGELLNYNGYGETLADLMYAPEQLFHELHPFDNPLEFARTSEAIPRLRDALASDLKNARSRAPELESAAVGVFRFPDEAWGRRVAGIFSNEQTRQHPDRAMALLVENEKGGVLVSMRAPLSNPREADTLCRRFGGGGRSKAAGINHLPSERIPEFLDAFREIYER